MRKHKKNHELGKMGEKLALEHLISRGYTLLNKNYRYRRSEIDIIMCHDQTLVFVEVKYRASDQFGFPEAFVTDNQIKAITQGAEQYLIENDWPGNIRFDIIAIDANLTITHFEDAFC